MFSQLVEVDEGFTLVIVGLVTVSWVSHIEIIVNVSENQLDTIDPGSRIGGGGRLIGLEKGRQ